MAEVYVGMGSNLGERKKSLVEALEVLQSHPAISQLRVSRFYETEPLSDIPQPDFINAVCRFETALEPFALLSLLQQIERTLGKVEKPKNAPRPIDLDLLFYGDLEMCTETLEIPHPRWRERLFVLKPLSELCEREDVKQVMRNVDEKSSNSGIYVGGGGAARGHVRPLCD